MPENLAENVSAESLAEGSSDRFVPANGRIDYGLAAIASALAIVLGWSYWPTIVEIVSTWNSNPDYNHGYFVVPLSCWFLYARRSLFSTGHIKGSWYGLVLILGACSLRYIAGRFYIRELDAWSIPVWVGGVVWMYGGFKLIRWSLPSVAFLWFMMALPATFEIAVRMPMQLFATTVSSWVLQIFALPAIPEGTTILLGDHAPLEIARACSGLRMFFGIAALAVAFVLLTRPPRWKTIYLLAATVPVALTANVIRIVTTGLLYQFAPEGVGEKFSHDFAGILMIPMGVVLFGCVSFVYDRVSEKIGQSPGKAASYLARYLIYGCVAAVLLLLWHDWQEDRAMQTLLVRAEALEDDEDWFQATVYLERYMRARPDDTETLIRLALTYDKTAVSEGRKRRALKLFGDAWEKRPDNMGLGVRRVELAYDLGQYQLAIDSAELLLKRLAEKEDIDSDNRLEHEKKALSTSAQSIVKLLDSRDKLLDYSWSDAISAIDKSLAKQPDQIDFWRTMAVIYREKLTEPEQQERNLSADEKMDEMVKINADLPYAWLVRYVYRKHYQTTDSSTEEELQAIESDLDKAILLSEKDDIQASAKVMFAAGLRSQTRKDFPAAQKFFEKTIAIDPQYYIAYTVLAEMLRKDFTTDDHLNQSADVLQRSLAAIEESDINRLIRIDLSLPLAEIYFELGRDTDAEALLRPIEALTVRWNDPLRSKLNISIAVIRARANAEDGKTRKAAEILAAILNVDRNLPVQLNTSYASAWLQLGGYYEQLRLSDLASLAFERAGNLNPSSVGWHWKAGQAMANVGQYQEAIAHFQAVTAQSPKDPVPWLALASASLRHQMQLRKADRNISFAFNAIKTAKSVGASDEHVATLGADYFAAQGRIAKAIQTVEEALAKDSQSTMLWRSMAYLQQQQGQIDESLAALDQFDKFEKSELVRVSLRAAILSLAEQFDTAEKLLRGSLKTISKKDQDPIYFQLARIEMMRGDRDGALKIMQELLAQTNDRLTVLETLCEIALDENHWELLESYEDQLRTVEGIQIGTVWREIRVRHLLSQTSGTNSPEFREATKLTNELVTLRPRWQKAHILLGKIAQREQRIDAALNSYEYAWSLGAKNIRLAENLIELLTKRGDNKKAGMYIERVREYLSISSRLLDSSLPYYALRGDRDEAIRLAEGWVKKNPKDAIGHMRLGNVLAIVSDETTAEGKITYKKAEKEFEKAIELAPTNVITWAAQFRFHAIYRKDLEAALTVLEKLAGQKGIPPVDRAFSIAQLYESIRYFDEAGQHYIEAASHLNSAKDVEAKIRVLERAALFFFSIEPDRAEKFCRLALSLNSNSKAATETLIRILVQKESSEALREAFELFAKSRDIDNLTPNEKGVYAVLLALRKGSGDEIAATEILEDLKNRSDLEDLQLARLYTIQNRIEPAQRIFWNLADDPDAKSIHLTAYIQFWHQQFAKEGAFMSRVEKAYKKLENVPQTSLLALQLRLEQLKYDENENRDETDAVNGIIDNYVNGQLKAHEKVQDKTLFVNQLFIRLVQLGKIRPQLAKYALADQTVRLANRQPSIIPRQRLAQSLAQSLSIGKVTKQAESEADKFFASVLREHPDDEKLLMLLANMQYMNRKNVEAVRLYKRLIKINPEHASVINNLAVAMVDAPNKKVEAGEFAKATALIDGLISKQGREPGVLDTKAQILYYQKKFDASLELLLEATRGGNPDRTSLFHLAYVYNQLDDRENARKVFMRARRLNIDGALLTPRDQDDLKRLKQDLGL